MPCRAGVVLLVLLSSCSFALSGKIERGVGTTEPACWDSFGLAALDGIGAALFYGVAADLVAVGEWGEKSADYDGSALITNLAIVGTAYAIAAGIGTSRSVNCRKAKSRWHRENREPAIVTPTRTPDQINSFWCSTQGCSTERQRCKGACRQQVSAWCSLHKREYVCASDELACQNLIAYANGVDANTYGRCEQRSAGVPAPSP